MPFRGLKAFHQFDGYSKEQLRLILGQIQLFLHNAMRIEETIQTQNNPVISWLRWAGLSAVCGSKIIF